MKKPTLPPKLVNLKDHYRLLKRLGAGTFGEVWLAEAPGGVQVAVKRIFRSIDQAEGQRELRVLELVKNLRHPFLLATQAYWQEEDKLCIVMELADGSLRDSFRQFRKHGQPGIPLDPLLRYVTEAAEALDFLHEQQVLHRDIKPENLLHLHGHIKVCDFGLARASDSDMQSGATFCGTASYMPPEIWQNRLSIHSDQYSLALTYVEMRTGHMPYRGKGLGELMREHMKSQPDLSLLPAEERKVIVRALSKDPDKRYPSCQEFAEELVAAAMPHAEPGLRGSPRTRSLRVQSPLPRRRWLKRSLAAGVACMAAGAAAWKWVWPHPSDPNPPAPPVSTPSPPRMKQPWLPPGFTAVEDPPTAGERLYKTIAAKWHGMTFQFKLIPGVRIGDGYRYPFYMLDNKVTVAQFRAVADTDAFKKKLADLEKHHTEKKSDDLPTGGWRAETLTTRGDYPVRMVTVTEAHCFAECLRCRLPSAQQWDRAGGRYADGGHRGPAIWRTGDTEKENKGIAVGGDVQPVVGESTDRDVSCYGCRNMAGNGYEWTRDITDRGGSTDVVPLQTPTERNRVQVRGTPYFSVRQFLFGENTPVGYFYTAQEYSFRMVLEIPEDILSAD